MKEYLTIEAESGDSFETLINIAAKEGWVLHTCSTVNWFAVMERDTSWSEQALAQQQGEQS